MGEHIFQGNKVILWGEQNIILEGITQYLVGTGTKYFWKEQYNPIFEKTK